MTESPLRREAYDIYGSGPLRYVLVHGVGGDRNQWRTLAEHLAIRAGVLAIDLAGHGAAHHVGGPYRISRFAAAVAEIAYRRVPDGAVLVGHSIGAAVCLEAARMLGEATNHVIGIDALFPELFGAHAARKSRAARVLLRTPLAAPTIDSWVERFFVAPYDTAVRNAVRQTMLNTARPVLADSVASLLRWQRDEALAASPVPGADPLRRPRSAAAPSERASTPLFDHSVRMGRSFLLHGTTRRDRDGDQGGRSRRQRPRRDAMRRTDHDE